MEVRAEVYTFDIEVTMLVLEVINEPCLVCFRYSTRRGLASTQAVTPHRGDHDAVFLKVGW